MRLFGRKGPAELDGFGSLDTLVAAACTLSDDFPGSDAFVRFLTSDSAGQAPALLAQLATLEQGQTLQRKMGDFYQWLKFVVAAKTNERQVMEENYAAAIIKFVSHTLTGLEVRPNPHPWESPMALVTVIGAARMENLRRYSQAQAALKEGVVQIATLILTHDLTLKIED